MSVMVSSIRQFWMPTLNQVSGNPNSRLSDWVLEQKYYVVTVPLLDKHNFSLDLTNNLSLVSSFAFDCNRMASASFESMHSIQKSNSKAFAWLIIQSYYAAFFAAHSILRILGISCTQLDQKHINKIIQIAKLYGIDNGIQLENGYYSCTYEHVDQKLIFENLKSSSGGSHELFWKYFHRKISELRDNILSSSVTATLESQKVAVQLDALCDALCHHGCNGGNWLSYVRNSVNYRHEMSAWFPYSQIKKSFVDELYENCQKLWNIDFDPINFDLASRNRSDIHLFHRICCFIIGLCHSLIQDMSLRCTQGNSYLSNGCIKFLNLNK